MGGTGSNAPSAATREGSNASSLPETGNADELEGAPQDGSASSGEFDESGLAETTTSSGDQPPAEPASSSTPPVASGTNISSRDELINSPPPRTSGSPQPSIDTAPAPIAPVLVVPPEIKYPERALRRGEEAVVLLRVKVDTAGRVVDAEGAPRQDVPDEFLKAAIAAAFGARYQPATLDGKPIEFWTPLRIAFELK